MTEKPPAASTKNLDSFWKCLQCGHTMQAATPPKTCPSCKQECAFKDVSCYTPDCGGPGHMDPRL